jgi:hypothetical protein
MTHEEKINYMRISTGLCCFSFKMEHLDLLVSLYELIIGKQGKTDLRDVIEVEYACKEREKVRKKEELLKERNQNETGES